MNKKIRKILFLLIFSAIITLSTVFSLMIKETPVMENELEPIHIQCVINEDFDGKDKSNVTVKNESNADVYLRVKIVHYWQDSKGNTVGLNSTLPSFEVNENWSYSQSENVYYYIKPLKVGEETTNLYNGKITLQTKEETSDNGIKFTYNQVVEVHAEAIQAKPTLAVEKSWRVDVENNIIISVPEN